MILASNPDVKVEKVEKNVVIENVVKDLNEVEKKKRTLYNKSE